MGVAVAGLVSEPLLRVQYRLTGRDLVLLGWLADHGTLTTPQIAHALYPSLGFAQRRLRKLMQAGVIDRFRPHRPDGGSHPYHYLLSQLGVDVVAAQRDAEDPPRRDQARRRRWLLTNRVNLPHLLATNQFFTDLAGYARTHPNTELTDWLSSQQCQQSRAFRDLEDDAELPYQIWGATVAADGHGIWTEHHPDGSSMRVRFFVEIDLGTEDLPRLVDKLDAYERFARTTGHVWPVLFWLGTTVRERHLHTRLAQRASFVPVATAARDLVAQEGTSPAEDVWWLHAQTEPRPRTLTDLAATVTRIRQTPR